MPDNAKPMMILVAGPYRSGTNDDPALIRRNVQEMESYVLPVFRAGHIPILGEWLALPLVKLAGSRKIGDRPSTKYFIPSPFDSWRNAMVCFGSGGHRPGPTKWCGSAGALG